MLIASPTEADALSTALLVLGRSGLQPMARAFPEAGLLVAERGGEGGVRVTTAGPGFASSSPP